MHWYRPTAPLWAIEQLPAEYEINDSLDVYRMRSSLTTSHLVVTHRQQLMVPPSLAIRNIGRFWLVPLG